MEGSHAFHSWTHHDTHRALDASFDQSQFGRRFPLTLTGGDCHVCGRLDQAPRWFFRGSGRRCGFAPRLPLHEIAYREIDDVRDGDHEVPQVLGGDVAGGIAGEDGLELRGRAGRVAHTRAGGRRPANERRRERPGVGCYRRVKCYLFLAEFLQFPNGLIDLGKVLFFRLDDLQPKVLEDLDGIDPDVDAAFRQRLDVTMAIFIGDVVGGVAKSPLIVDLDQSDQVPCAEAVLVGLCVVLEPYRMERLEFLQLRLRLSDEDVEGFVAGGQGLATASSRCSGVKSRLARTRHW